MSLEPIAEGAWGTVVWAVDASGNAPALEFFSSLSDGDAAKMETLFNRFANTGKIHNQQQFKKLDDVRGQALFEFKRFQLRFLGGFAPGGQFVVALGLRKKKDAHSRQHLERAARILNEHHEREAQRYTR